MMNHKSLKIVIIDYGLGNLFSVAGAVEKLGYHPVVSSSIEDVNSADKLILPGVGAFGDGMANLRKRNLIEPLTAAVCRQKTPILGICLGFQLMASDSDEFGNHEGLCWLPASVKKIQSRPDLRIPHIGWNDLYQKEKISLFDGIPDTALFYYVHSYHVICRDPNLVAGECDYGIRLTAAAVCGNIYGTQFHPEKSQFWGLKVLENFLKWS